MLSTGKTLSETSLTLAGKQQVRCVPDPAGRYTSLFALYNVSDSLHHKLLAGIM